MPPTKLPPNIRPASRPVPAAAPAAPAAPPARVVSEEEVLKRLLHGAAAATLVYGDTGSGKTTLLATFADWVWRKFHAPTRLYACDPGGYSDDVLALINVGIIEVWRMYTRDPLGKEGLPSETLQRACQGWWPVEIDPATGECPVAVRLEPPSPEARFAVAFDGISGMQDWSMVDMGHRAAMGTLGGEGANMKPILSGDMKMGAGNRASVGFTQNKCRDWVLSSLSIPNLVAAPIFTALELKIVDERTQLPMYGPKLAGQAKTAEAPAWFGATVGTCCVQLDKGQREWRLYLRDYVYPATDLTPHKCKIRSSAAMPETELVLLPDYLADLPGEAALSRFNLGYLFDTLEQVRLTALARVKEKFPDAPGLKASTIGTAPAATRVAPGGLRPGPGPAALPGGARPSILPAAPAAAPAPAPNHVATESAPVPAAAPVPPGPALAPAGPSVAPPPVSAPATTASPTAAVQAIPSGAASLGGRRPAPAGIRPVPRAPLPAAPVGAEKKS